MWVPIRAHADPRPRRSALTPIRARRLGRRLWFARSERLMSLVSRPRCIGGAPVPQVFSGVPLAARSAFRHRSADDAFPIGPRLRRHPVGSPTPKEGQRVADGRGRSGRAAQRGPSAGAVEAALHRHLGHSAHRALSLHPARPAPGRVSRSRRGARPLRRRACSAAAHTRLAQHVLEHRQVAGVAVVDQHLHSRQLSHHPAPARTSDVGRRWSPERSLRREPARCSTM